jgi:RND superfamily putative drug exporter
MRFSPESLARSSSKRPWITIGLWFLLIVSMGFLSSRLLGDVLTQDIEFTNEPESVRAQNVLDEKFPGTDAGNDTVFFLVGSDEASTDEVSFQRRVTQLQDQIAGLGDTVVAGPATSYLTMEDQAATLFTPDHHGALLALQMNGDAEETLPLAGEAAASAAPEGFEASALTLPEYVQLVGPGSGEAPPDPPEGFVLVSNPNVVTTDAAFQQAVATVQGALVQAVGPSLNGPPASGYDLQARGQGLVSQDGAYALLPVPLADNTDEIVMQIREVASSASGQGFTVQVAGNPTLFADFTKLAEEDLRRGESIGLGIALIVLIVVFASVVAAVVPIVMALFAIAVAVGLVAVIGQLVEFNLFVTNMVTMIGLAVGIDYSLFIVSRYREERKKGFEKLEAIGAAGATANRAVFFSGMTVVLALLGMFIIPTTIFRSLAGGAILVTLVSIAASMTLLPALLSLLGDRINWPRLARRARLDSDHDPKGGLWDRLTRNVMTRPVVFLVAGVVILGGLSAFYFQMQRGTSQNVSQLPDEFESKEAFLTLQREFAGGTSDPVRIVVQGEVNTPEAQAAVADLQEAIAASPDFAPTTQVTQAVDGRTLMVEAFFKGDPSADAAFQAIGDLRNDVVPGAFGGVSNVEVLVGGNTAFFTDFLSVADRYQWIVLAFVLALSFVLLTVVFRSIVVPIKAILLNLLSVGAAYGAVTLVFQKGVGIAIFNDILQFQFERVDSIEAWLPLFLFSVLFGLSMDYEVFLLTRIREEYDKSGDNTEAVAYGLRTTAGIITGAALIMVAVFTAFASGRIGAFQQMGFGLAVAVFMDATIVRSILVPASMRLLGDVNWYLPRWLQWLPRLNVEGHAPEHEVLVPEPQRVHAGEVAAETVRAHDEG